MLARASRRTAPVSLPVSLVHGDAQRLPFPSASFETVTATCVFCSVADPVPVAAGRDLARDQRGARGRRRSDFQRTRHGSEQKLTSASPSRAVCGDPGGTGMPHTGSIAEPLTKP